MKIEEFIEQTKMIKQGEVVGVAVSGGIDSMALLHYLNSKKEKYDIDIVAVHVDHGIRENSFADAIFVRNKCKEMGIHCYKFKIDALKIAKERNLSIETAAREGRYGVFDALIRKGVVDKIALAHHAQDQAETILMHIFRGSGVAGAKGMEPIRGGYIRPMLSTSKEEIVQYVNLNEIEYVEDETNFDSTYNRNFVRNKLMPEIEKRWPGVVNALTSLGKSVSEDDEFINSQVYADAMLYEDNAVRVPTTYFLGANAIVSRIIFKALKKIGVNNDVERKHIELIKELALNGENGTKISLPFEVVAVKEYDYLTLINKHKDVQTLEEPFKCGEFEVKGFGKVITKRVKEFAPKEGALFIDYRLVPKTAVWRFRQDGDMFTKFGGGTKKLKSYLIDIKMPQRLRSVVPVLADGNEILAIAGVEISDKVKVRGVPTAFMVTVGD